MFRLFEPRRLIQQLYFAKSEADNKTDGVDGRPGQTVRPPRTAHNRPGNVVSPEINNRRPRELPLSLDIGQSQVKAGVRRVGSICLVCKTIEPNGNPERRRMYER